MSPTFWHPSSARLLRALLVICALLPALSKVKDVTPVALEKIIDSSERLLLVEWYSPDCPFCRELAPILDEVSNNVKEFAYVVRLDMRASYELNRKFAVKSAPTMLLFNGGKQLLEARGLLQGLRDVDTLTQFLKQYRGTPVQFVSSATEIDDVIEEDGYAILGLFNTTQNKYFLTFKEIAEQKRACGRFLASAKSDVSTALAKHFDLPGTMPEIAIIQKHNGVRRYTGQHTNRTALDLFVSASAFASVGQLNALTYQRYADSPQPKVFTFYDQFKAEDSRATHELLQLLAPNYPDLLFVLVEARSSEGGKEPENRMHLRLGISDFRFPAVAVVTQNSTLVHDQLSSLSEASMKDLLALWQRPLVAHRQLCQVPSWKVKSVDYEPRWVSEYESYASEMATKVGGHESILDMNDGEVEALQLRSRRDVLVLYTTRWCLPALHMEAALVMLVQSGEIDDMLRDQLVIVRVDAVKSRPHPQYRTEALPQLRYLSARFKHVPHFYTGSDISAPALLKFIRTYHTLRYVDIPGEPPSEFAGELEEARAAEKSEEQRAISGLLAGRGSETDFDPEDVRTARAPPASY